MVLKTFTLVLKIVFDLSKKSNNNSHYTNLGDSIMEMLVKELAKPLLRRVGSMIAGALVSIGFATEQAVAFETAAIALLMVTCDLVLSHMDRKK
jgi:hypothetical protein